MTIRHPTYDVVLSLIEALSVKKGLDIVDAGCGNGLLVSMLKGKLIGKYIGIDISKDAIDQAKHKFGKNCKLSFRVDSCTKIPSKTKSVDLVISIGVLQYLTQSERMAFLKEAKRVLKPGGQLIVSCLTDHEIYKAIDLYGLFSPHGVVNRRKLLQDSSKIGFGQVSCREYGLILSPLTSQVLTVVFDAIDHFILGVRGKIGPMGKGVRSISYQIERLEYALEVDYGYTLIAAFKASGNQFPKSRGRT